MMRTPCWSRLGTAIGAISLAIGVSLLTLAPPDRRPVIQVYFPVGDDASVPAVQGTYILGNVRPPQALLTINGRRVPVYKQGGFVAYLPVRPGAFAFHLEATNLTGTTVTEVPLHVGSHSAQPSDMLIDPESAWPAQDVELRPGESVLVRARGVGGVAGEFEIAGVARRYPLRETAPGQYEGQYRLATRDRLQAAEIHLTFYGAAGPFHLTAPGRLTVLAAPYVAIFERAADEIHHIHREPNADADVLAWVPSGGKALVTGQVGDWARIQLGGDPASGWVRGADLRRLPTRAPPPKATVTSVRVRSATTLRASGVEVELSDRIPYRVERVGDLFRLVLYSTEVHGIPIVHDDPRIGAVRWTRGWDGAGHLDIQLSGRAPLWGWHVSSSASGLHLLLRWPPSPPTRSASPLDGAVIVVDAGHSPSEPGAIGPLGFSEREHNLNTARRLERLLQREGATVIMTRTRDDEEVSLQRRVQIAWQARADAFVSLHNNSVPHGTDPMAEPRGFSFFYSHPHSLALAQRLQRAYRRHIPLRDEGVHLRDLFVTRSPAMPAVLVESTYSILPEHEEMLLDARFQDRLARALVEGLREAFGTARTAIGAE